MCIPMNDGAMIGWLRHQVRVVEAWREELAMRSDIDIGVVTRLERHYAWLTSEMSRLDSGHTYVH